MFAAAFALSGQLTEPSNALQFRSPDLLADALLALATVPIAWRRKRPIVVLAIVQAATMPNLALNYNPTTFWVGLVVAIYTVAAYCNARTSIIALSIFSVVQFLFTLLGALNAPQEIGLDVFINGAVSIAGCWGLAVSVRTRRAYTTELEERARRLEREQEESAQKAVAAEQRRIARELHDVIAHNVSMMVVQSGAARRVLEEKPGLACDALRSVEEAGRGASLRCVVSSECSGKANETRMRLPHSRAWSAWMPSCPTRARPDSTSICPSREILGLCRPALTHRRFASSRRLSPTP